MIDQFGIKILLSGLLFLGTPVVVNGKKNALVFFTGRTQVYGRFGAIASDLQARPQETGLECLLVQAPTLIGIEKAFHRVYQLLINFDFNYPSYLSIFPKDLLFFKGFSVHDQSWKSEHLWVWHHLPGQRCLPFPWFQ